MKRRKNLDILLSDECVPELVNRFLETNLIKVLRVSDLKLSSEPDEIIFKEAQLLKLPLLTIDIKFISQIYQQKSTTNGLILLRYKGKINENLLAIIRLFLDNHDLSKLKNTLVVIDDKKFRINKRNLKHITN